MRAVLAMDVGGTKLEVGVVDVVGRILARQRASSQNSADAEQLYARLSGDLPVPVHIDNDAKAPALGEAWVGAAVGLRALGHDVGVR